MALEIRITTGSAVPLYRQIVEQIRRSVAYGDVRAGDPLPSVRVLAEQLVINANTVARAYNELTRDGVLTAYPGKGLYVAERRQIYSDDELQRRLAQATEMFVNEVVLLGFSHDDIIDHLRRQLGSIPVTDDPEDRT